MYERFFIKNRIVAYFCLADFYFSKIKMYRESENKIFMLIIILIVKNTVINFLIFNFVAIFIKK
jgi:hypothetical protein